MADILKNLGIKSIFIKKIPLPNNTEKFKHQDYKEKDIDIVYCGGIYSKEIYNSINRISHLNCKFSYYGRNFLFPRITLNPFYFLNFKIENVSPSKLTDYVSRSKAGLVFCDFFI